MSDGSTQPWPVSPASRIEQCETPRIYPLRQLHLVCVSHTYKSTSGEHKLTHYPFLVFPEMKTALRTYHPVPALQRTNGNLQDAPRIKNILKTCFLPEEAQGMVTTPSDVLARSVSLDPYFSSCDPSRRSPPFSSALARCRRQA